MGSRLIGNRWYAKALWLLLFPLFQLTRPMRLKDISVFNGWSMASLAASAAFDVTMLSRCLAPMPLLYLGASMLFSIGLHPLGSRWIQEHFTLDPDQETGSYYGSLNRLALNVGYHNEHHDFPSIPWNRLPAIRAHRARILRHADSVRLLDPALALVSSAIRAIRSIPACSEPKSSREARLSFEETRPRVALVTSSYNYIADGVALTLNRLVGYLESQGVEVLVFAPTADKPAFAHQGTLVPVPSIPLPGRPEYRLAWAWPAIVKRQLAGFRSPTSSTSRCPTCWAMPPWRWRSEHGIPAVASYHTRYETYLRHYWYLAGLEKRADTASCAASTAPAARSMSRRSRCARRCWPTA